MSKMLQETRQQPEALAKTLEEAAARLRELRRHLEAHRPRLVTLVARGTSDNAAQFGRYLIEISTHIPVSLAAPSPPSIAAESGEGVSVVLTRTELRTWSHRRAGHHSYRSGRYRTWPSHSPGLLHSVSRRMSSTAVRTLKSQLTSNTPGIGSPFITRR
jgi:hypothetical protein